MARVYVSYSSAHNKAFAKRLKDWLAGKGHEILNERPRSPGQTVAELRDSLLRQAEFAIAVCSNEYLKDGAKSAELNSLPRLGPPTKVILMGIRGALLPEAAVENVILLPVEDEVFEVKLSPLLTAATNGEPSEGGGNGSRQGVFAAYSHDDPPLWKEELEKLLRPVFKKDQVWSDTNIVPGDKWEVKIRAAIARAKVALLLVSKNFLASDFILEQELPLVLKAQDDGLKLGWVCLDDCMWEGLTELASRQALHDVKVPLSNLPQERLGKELKSIAQKLRDLVQA